MASQMGHGPWGWDVGAVWHVATSTASAGEEAGGPCTSTVSSMQLDGCSRGRIQLAYV